MNGGRLATQHQAQGHADLLGLVGNELAALSAEMRDLQTTLSPALVSLARDDAAVVVTMQDFDRIEQTLVNLSWLMAALHRQGQSIHPTVAQDALGEISMADLRRRLGCLRQARTAACRTTDVELF